MNKWDIPSELHDIYLFVMNHDLTGKGCHKAMIMAYLNKGEVYVTACLDRLGSEGLIYEVSLHRYKVL